MSFSDVNPPRALTRDGAGLHVAILLTTFNGGRFLEEQLNSIAGQTHRDWTLYISDDGSSDATPHIIERFQQRLGSDRVHLFNGPRVGFAQNFLSLVRNSKIEADFFAFSDQDDIWFPDKLERALARLPQVAGKCPAMYCSRTRLVDESGNFIGYSPLFVRTPSFQNALVQSLAGANTMLLNRSARDLLAAVPSTAPVVSHDWLCYLLVSGCGGQVFYDAQPTIDYRQHGGNVIGSNTGLLDRWLRIRRMLSGTFRDWNQNNLVVLRHFRSQLTAENRDVLCQFVLARKSCFAARLRLLWEAGLYRQTILGNIGLVVAVSMRKI